MENDAQNFLQTSITQFLTPQVTESLEKYF